MTDREWIPLLEFSLQHRVSPSTVRRKIKAGKLESRLEGGKYLIRATPPSGTSSVIVGQDLEGVLRYADETLQTLKEAHRLLTSEKDREIERLKAESQRLSEEVNELKMLIELLEKPQSV